MKHPNRYTLSVAAFVITTTLRLIGQNPVPRLLKPSKAPISFGDQSSNPAFAGMKVERSRSVQIDLQLVNKNAAD